jgi:hypothetical protein
LTGSSELRVQLALRYVHGLRSLRLRQLVESGVTPPVAAATPPVQAADPVVAACAGSVRTAPDMASAAQSTITRRTVRTMVFPFLLFALPTEAGK